MCKNLVIIGLLLLASRCSALLADDAPLDVGTYTIGSRLELDGYYHKLGDDWTLTKTAGGLNNNYTLNTSTPVKNSWNSAFGETLFVNAGFHPSEHLKGELEFEAIGGYADRYWMPVNLEHRMSLDGQNLNWNKGEITYSEDWMSLRYFRNIGHYNWSGQGDLFDLYTQQNEENKYLRISGRSAPEGYELDLNGSAGKLQLIYGREVVWNYFDGFYANYSFELLGLSSNLIYRNHIIPYGDPNERMSDTELSTTIDISGQPLQLGVLYQPFRLNTGYTYVNYVAPGAGYLGTPYNIETGVTGQSDAMGYSAKLTLDRLPYMDEVVFQLSQLGLVAGDKRELDAQFTKKISRDVTGVAEYLYRKPLLGPVPLVFEGTSANPGPALLEPRDPGSPFWVNWDNREANIISFLFTFNPDPGAPFYKYEPTKLEEWNLNDKNIAPLSFAAKYSLKRYFTGTDRLYYSDDNGNTVWEGPLLTEPWATDGYIGDFVLFTKVNTDDYRIIFDIGGGDSLALNAFSYSTPPSIGKPITGYFVSGISVARKPYTFKFSYSQNEWGPEDWHQSYGETFDHLYQAHISRTFGNSVTAGLEYTGARKADNTAPELGDYDEFRGFFSITFGPIIAFSGAPPVIGQPVGETPVTEMPPPQVSLTVPVTSFLLADGAALEMQSWAADFSGVASWKLEISDTDGEAVKTFSGNGQPPYSTKWDGKNDAGGPAEPGKYFVRLSARNPSGGEAQSPEAVIVLTGPAGAEAPQNVKVTKSDRGLVVSLASKTLFGVGKSNLKPEAGKALDEVVKILNTYKENKLSVEGHTDKTGNPAANQKLSEKRARSVADYLIKSGISKSRISLRGYGASKPAASNRTEKSRELNRRVEVIILK